MDELIEPESEIREIRRELEDIRREYKTLQGTKRSRPDRQQSAGRENFMSDFQTSLAEQIQRRPALARVLRRLTALERRVDELERRKHVTGPLNSAPR
jgi:hypothetical protein